MIIIGLVFISLQGKLKVTQVTKYFLEKREKKREKKTTRFLEFS